MSHIRKTPLYDIHRQLEAKMVDFHGWFLPVEYSGIIQEVQGTRQDAALFDVSHMGEFLITGKDAGQFLQEMLTNDLSRLKPGQVLYSPLCQQDGGTIDDLMVYCLDQERFFLVVNASNTIRDLQWLQEHQMEGAEVADVTEEYALIALQGPRSQNILQELTNTSLGQLPPFRFITNVSIVGITCLVSRTGYTGEDGFEIFCSPEKAPSLWEALWETGQKDSRGLIAAGLGARDLLRLEACLPLYGNELSRDISPLEAGLHRFVALEKHIPFVGQEALQRQYNKGLPRKLAGLEMLRRGVPRQGYSVVEEDEEIGLISSGSFSPTLNRSIALAFLPPEKTSPGTKLEVVIRGRQYPSRVVKIPFYRRGEK